MSELSIRECGFRKEEEKISLESDLMEFSALL
jgi:hypothetical protein